MKIESGIVRRIDDLGRLVVPQKIRSSLSIQAGENFEISYDKEARSVTFTALRSIQPELVKRMTDLFYDMSVENQQLFLENIRNK